MADVKPYQIFPTVIYEFNYTSVDKMMMPSYIDQLKFANKKTKLVMIIRELNCNICMNWIHGKVLEKLKISMPIIEIPKEDM